MKIVKKLLVCGLSLIIMGNLTNGAVSAKHTNHISSNIIRMDNHKNFKYMNKLNDEYKANLGDKTVHNIQTAFVINKDTQYRLQRLGNSFFRHHINCFSKNQLQDIDIDDTGFLLNNNDSKLLHKRILQLECSHVKTLSIQDNSFDTTIRSNLVKDINQTRIHYGLKPLIVTDIMQRVANYRNPKVQYAYDHLSDYINYPHNTSNPYDNWVHGEDTHTTGYDYLRNHGYEYTWSANAGNWSSKYTLNGDRTPAKYSNDTPEHIAGNINDGIVNHDNCEGNYNGHRKNELNPSWKYLGVGVTYNPQTQQGTFNEQFAK